ncbi:MAG: phosphotransferase [Ilumatobacteraceae bacterium]
MAIPNGPEGITPAWLREHVGFDVTSVEVVEIGAGIGVSSAVYRASLTGENVPDSVVVKLIAKDPAAAFTSAVLKFYRREVQFYDKLADEAPVRTPHGYFGEVTDDDADVVIVMEDLIGNRIVDQTQKVSMDDAHRVVDAIADWHAHWWNRTEGLCEARMAVALSDPIYPAMLPGLFEEGWAKLNASADCVPHDRLQPIGERWSKVVGELLQQLSTGSMTMLHGDVRADNIMFSDEDEPIFMDFQILGVGSAAYDIAYFITQSLDVTAGEERALFDQWTARLEANGVPHDDLAVLWEQYRVAALFCLVYPVVAARGMDLDDAREAALANAMLHRFERAEVDLDLVSILP